MLAPSTLPDGGADLLGTIAVRAQAAVGEADGAIADGVGVVAPFADIGHGVAVGIGGHRH